MKRWDRVGGGMTQRACLLGGMLALSALGYASGQLIPAQTAEPGARNDRGDAVGRKELCPGGPDGVLATGLSVAGTFEEGGHTGIELDLDVAHRFPGKGRFAYAYVIHNDRNEEIQAAPAPIDVPLTAPPGGPTDPGNAAPDAGVGPGGEAGEAASPPKPPAEVGKGRIRLTSEGLPDGYYELLVRGVGAQQGKPSESATFSAASAFLHVVDGEIRPIEASEYYGASRARIALATPTAVAATPPAQGGAR